MANLNIQPNALFTADNLYVLNGMNSECIDLIYLDPPFNSKRLYKAPVGSKAAGAAFEDMWSWEDVDSALMVRLAETHPFLVDYITAIEVMHSKGMMAYIAYMAQRLFEMHRVLKPTGSIYLHCDPTASHYLKVVMDRIFGAKNFRNEIVWKKYAGRKSNAKTKFPTQHDCIFFYAKSADAHFTPIYLPMAEKEIAKEYNKVDADGRRYRLSRGRNYQLKGEQRKIYLDETRGRMVGGLWVEDGLQLNTSSAERTGYPTQKPLALLDRIIKASSKEGDVVLDPFCGCATTCVSAQRLGRRWIGIDVSDKAAVLIRERMADDVGALFDDFTHYAKPPMRGDVERITKQAAKPILYGTQAGHCAGCKDHFEARHLEVDHVIPRSKGGGDYLANFQLLCGNCNRIKGNRPMEYLLMVLAKRQRAHKVFGMDS